MESEPQRLADFSEAVRESTLKRLRRVPAGSENWRLRPDSLSFADLAQHLIDADRWLLAVVETGRFLHAEAALGMRMVRDRKEYENLLLQLMESQAARKKWIEGLQPQQWEMIVDDPKFGKISVWWALVRGNLDHEIHHRGQIAVYLKAVLAENSTVQK